MIDCITLLWCWNVEALKHEILKLKKFKKILRNELIIYILILSNKNENVIVSMILYKIIDYINVFFKKNAEKLPEYEEDDYVIKLNKQDSSFEFLYNLSSSELKTLWKYFDNVLVKGWIRHFISPAEASVLFVPKRDGSLHLCVDY